MSELRTCDACGTPLEASERLRGLPRRFCDVRCRKAAHRASQRATDIHPSTDSGARAGRQAEREGPPGLGAVPGVGTPPETAEVVNVPWYYAKFAATAGQRPYGPLRRAVRWQLRQLLNQVTNIDRCRSCGRDLLGSAAAIVVNDGTAHFAGVETCGRVWLCPVCAAKIRARRGDEIAEAVGRHIAAGGGAYFVTATLSHEQGDALAVSLQVLTDAWRYLTSGRQYGEERDAYSILGSIKAVEITYGRKGWHPHIHAVILTGKWVDLASGEMAAWYASLDARWARGLVRYGWTPGIAPYRFRLDLVTRSTSALAAYVTKVQESGLGNEIARSDMKVGRKSSRTPLQILADFGTYGLADDLDLWHEYEQATIGKSAIRWSRGLRKLLLPELVEQSDDEIAAEEIGGDTVAYVLPSTWYRLADIPGAQAAVLDAVEADGWNGLIRTLVGYRLGVDGVMAPDEWEQVGAGDVPAGADDAGREAGAAAVAAGPTCPHRQPCKHGPACQYVDVEPT
jgi:hypothetical protein